jgi:hypothetical protein
VTKTFYWVKLPHYAALTTRITPQLAGLTEGENSVILTSLLR